jgi:hypothetical protein
MANDTVKAAKKKGGIGPVLRGFRPAVPATVGAFVLTLLFAAMMPMPWVSAICWNLYLDTIHPIFAPPLGNAARLGVALGLAIIAALIALVIALAMVKPAVKGNQAMNQRVAKRARQTAAEPEAEDSSEDSQLLRRRRIDAHPDAPPVAPIRADRDLPEGGLGPTKPVPVDYGLNSAPQTYQAERRDNPADALLPENDGDFLDLGFAEQLDEPAPPARPVAPAPGADQSLGAMVARFEAGLDKRRNRPAADAAEPVPAPAPANEDDGPAVDLALEAALATLQRMSKSAVG